MLLNSFETIIEHALGPRTVHVFPWHVEVSHLVAEPHLYEVEIMVALVIEEEIRTRACLDLTGDELRVDHSFHKLRPAVCCFIRSAPDV